MHFERVWFYAAVPKLKRSVKDLVADEKVDAAAQMMLSPNHPGQSKELLRRIATDQMGGYAITAKPSANLYILLQVKLFCRSMHSLLCLLCCSVI